MIYAVLILQIICILATGVGIYVEYTLGADVGYLLITAGAFSFAISTKLTKIKLVRVLKKLSEQLKINNNV